MPTIRKTTGGRWRAEVKRTFDGADGPVQRRWSQTFNLKAAARSWALDLEDLIDNGGDPDAPDPRAPAPTVGEWHDRWWAARVAEKTTLAANKQRLRKHVLPRWRNVPLDEVKPLDVQSWVKRLERDGLAAATVGSIHQLLSGMLSAAVREGLLTANPCTHTRLPTPSRGREVYLTRGQVDQLAEATRTRRDRLLILLLAYTGLRWGEASGLRIGDVDLLRRRLSVVRVETRYGSKEHPKSDASRRLVPLPRFLADELAAFIPMNAPRDRLLFTTRDGGPLHDQPWRRRAWVAAVKKAELGAVGVRPHDLRHTYCSWLVQAGVSLEEVRLLAGHESLRTTLRYAHFKPDHGLAAVSVLERPGARQAPDLGSS